MTTETKATRDEPAAGATLLLVDDNVANLQVLRESVEGLGARILVARSGAIALAIVEKTRPDLVLLDIMMPEMDGYEVCRRLKAAEATRTIPVLFLTALGDPEDEALGLSLGAVDYIAKPIHPDLVRARVRNHLELSRYRSRLEESVRQRTRELQRTQTVMIEALATLAESRDPETGGHIKRTQNYVKALAVTLKRHPAFSAVLDDETIELLHLSTPLHDIGKVGVPDAILLKPGKLTDDEYEVMRRHTTIGYDALRSAQQKLGGSTFLRLALEIAVSHHERWDGAGYPHGLRETGIPVAGRLMAVADVYDALVSKRVYKPPMPHDEAVKIISKGRGSQFDPDVVDAFLEIAPLFSNIARTFADYEEERRMHEGADDTAGRAGAGVLRRVLLVDDNAINREIMSSQLTSDGYQVQVAENGRAALALYREHGFDLVLTDIEMPEGDGYELVAAIRSLEKESGHLAPIFAITASEFELSAESARAHGFTGYMLKPLDLDLLERKLADLRLFFPGGSD